MKPAKFEYADPTALEEALGLLDEDAKVLAGGQSLVPMLNLRVLRPRRLVDINRVAGLDHIVRDGAVVRIGALARQKAVARSADAGPLIRAALRHVGHPQTRTRGTVCGSLAHNDPAAELGAVAACLGAEFVTRSRRGERVIPAADWFVDYYATCLEPDELLIEVRFPLEPPGAGVSFSEVSRRPGDFAIVGCAALVAGNSARVALCGVGGRPVALEIPNGWESDPEESAVAACRHLDPDSDIQADAAYRKEIAAVLVRRALKEASRCAASA